MINGQLFEVLLLREDGDLEAFNRLLACLPLTERMKLFSSLLRYLTSTFFNKPSIAESSSRDPVISAVAGLICKVTPDETFKKTCIVDWLIGPVGAGPDGNTAIRRAVLACLAKDEHSLADVLEKSMDQFGDDLYIKHTPMLQHQGRASSYSPRANCVKLTSPSSGSSRSSQRRAPQPIVIPAVQDPSTFADVPRHGVEPAQFCPRHREVSWYGRGRSPFVSRPRGGNETRLPYGRDEYGRGEVV